MHSLNENPSGYIDARRDIALKEKVLKEEALKKEVISSGKETTDSSGHRVKQVPPISPALKQDTSSDGQKSSHDTVRLLNSGLAISLVNSGEFSGEPDSKMPVLTPPDQHTQPDPPCGGLGKPFYKANPELKRKLLKLAGIPDSIHQRQYPRLGACDTVCVGKKARREKLKETVEEIISEYSLLTDTKFENHIKSQFLNKSPDLIQEVFSNREHFMWNNPGALLELVGQYIFRDDPVLKNISFSGEHGFMLSFLDHEILKVHQPIENKSKGESLTSKSIDIKYTLNERPIIQQQAARGCSYATAAMLIHQHNGNFSVSDLLTSNICSDKSILMALSKAGLSPFKSRFANIGGLTHAVNQHGSAIVPVDLESGIHFVIVDEVKDTSVLVRDPYHGWEVEVLRDAFETYWKKEAIQVKERMFGLLV
ncbi:cysteine peptidase family C39 domain-containing protein [Endozoicomonas sp. ONNA2]|uniref:cysteine peptidase family C39 domain-containing protein n=1 Tax=Endozoicomonas sp. ONNA2 TaxID=2828741 RepID=UPI002147D80A|nr:cysteine peptidase family C39 domain-containing protein [Endozoicomonas sp. ONNA2]